jgi:FkbM family methyltransferase
MNSKVLRDLLLHVFRLQRCYRPRALVANPAWSYANPLRLVVAYHQLDKPDFTFVQIGAFDGLENDCLHEIIDHTDNARGILVEPQEAAFQRLRETYADYPNLQLVNAAISISDEPRQFFSVANAAVQLASLDRSHLLRHKVPSDQIVVRTVPCHTLATLLRTHGFSGLDLLQIDAEGHDYEIMKTIDFAANPPAIIRFEHAHLTRRESDECIGLLARWGYRFLSERRDTIAFLERSPTRRAA